MPSSRANALIASSTKKVCATGAGSASPVVSMITWSTFFFRFAIASNAWIRSPRTVQQMQPLFISKISSSELNLPFTSASSTPTSPNSFSITAILRPWF